MNDYRPPVNHGRSRHLHRCPENLLPVPLRHGHPRLVCVLPSSAPMNKTPTIPVVLMLITHKVWTLDKSFHPTFQTRLSPFWTLQHMTVSLHPPCITVVYHCLEQAKNLGLYVTDVSLWPHSQHYGCVCGKQASMSMVNVNGKHQGCCNKEWG